jgi:hypothetical protein
MAWRFKLLRRSRLPFLAARLLENAVGSLYDKGGVTLLSVEPPVAFFMQLATPVRNTSFAVDIRSSIFTADARR